jgi:hypothetical protein
VFRPDELDSDDEIPAPFCYQKHKEALGLKSDMQPNLYGVVPEHEEEDDMVEREYRMMRQAQGEGSQDGADLPPSGFLAPGRRARQELFNPNDQDQFERILQPIRPKGKGELIASREPAKFVGESPPKIAGQSPEWGGHVQTQHEGTASLGPESLVPFDQEQISS